MSDRAKVLNSAGFRTKLRFSDQSPKPGTALDVEGRQVLASFSNWNTGETDYDIANLNADRLSSKWGLLLDDQTFEAAFDAFIAELQKHEHR